MCSGPLFPFCMLSSQTIVITQSEDWGKQKQKAKSKKKKKKSKCIFLCRAEARFPFPRSWFSPLSLTVHSLGSGDTFWCIFYLFMKNSLKSCKAPGTLWCPGELLKPGSAADRDINSFSFTEAASKWWNSLWCIPFSLKVSLERRSLCVSQFAQ